MVNLAQIITTLLSLGILAGGAWIMSLFFGVVGAVLVVVFTAIVLGIGIALTVDFSGDGGGNRAQRQSKGAQQQED